MDDLGLSWDGSAAMADVDNNINNSNINSNHKKIYSGRSVDFVTLASASSGTS